MQEEVTQKTMALAITTSRMTDNADVIIEVDGVHFRKLACTGNCL